MTGVIAQQTGRTFVLPPAEKVYLLDFGPLNGRAGLKSQNFDEESSKTKVEDLINLAQLKGNLATLTWDEFQQRTGLTFENAKAKAGKVDGEACPSLADLKSVKDDILYIDGQKQRQGFACGEWPQLGGPQKDLRTEMTNENWRLLTHGFVWHPDAFSIASKVVDQLGLFQYNALHGRYGDLQYQDVKTEPSKIFQNWPSLLQNTDTLYIASDNPEKFENRSIDFGKVNVLRWSDLFTQKTNFLLKDEQAKYTPERWFKLMGPVEELICTYSKLFVGTKLSTFSGHIHRMRIHAQAPVTAVHKHDEKEVAGNISKQLAQWSTAEASYHGHDPNSGDIFLELDPLASAAAPFL
jgi:hypothetical protein